jgi:hypothetical protein
MASAGERREVGEVYEVGTPEPQNVLLAETPLSRNLSTKGLLGNIFRAFLASVLTTLVIAVVVVHSAVFASASPGVYGGPGQIEIAIYWAIAVYALRSVFLPYLGGIDSINVLFTKWLGWDKTKNSGIDVFDGKLVWPVLASLFGIVGGWFAGAGIGYGIFNGTTFSLDPEARVIPSSGIVNFGVLFLLQLVPKLFIALAEAFCGHKENGNLIVAVVTGAMVGAFSPVIGPAVGFVHALAFEAVIGGTFGNLWVHILSELASILVAVFVYWAIFKLDVIKEKGRKVIQKAKALRN